MRFAIFEPEIHVVFIPVAVILNPETTLLLASVTTSLPVFVIFGANEAMAGIESTPAVVGMEWATEAPRSNCPFCKRMPPSMPVVEPFPGKT